MRRVLELRTELEIFFLEKDHVLEPVTNPEWLALLAYMADVFDHLNSLNRNLQGPQANVISSSKKIQPFRQKLLLWKDRIQPGRLATFPILAAFLKEDERITIEELSPAISSHLESLKQRFKDCFPELEEEINYAWIADHFQAEVSNESLAESHFDLQHSMEAKRLLEFRLGPVAKTVALQLADETVKHLTSFATTYLCEAGFSIFCTIKTKGPNPLDAASDLKCALSKCEPDWGALSKIVKW